MKYKISGEKSLKKIMQMAESDFNNKERSVLDHVSTIAFLKQYQNEELLEFANRMEYDLELLKQ
jgi:hypothetical protein